MGLRPHVNKSRRPRFRRCPKCNKQVRVHQRRCRACHRVLQA